MRLSAFLLILGAAGVHAAWNMFAKRAGGGAPFVWLYATVSTVLWLPPVVPILKQGGQHLGGREWIFVMGSGLIHMGYFLVLQRGYARADLSLLYPIARGSGPVIASAAAVAIYGERPSATALVGLALIVTGIGLLARRTSAPHGNTAPAIGYGLATGLLIGTYTVWDKHAVSTLAVSPLLMEWFTSVVRTIGLLPVAWVRREEVVDLWRNKRRFAIVVGVLNPLAYVLILEAMTFTPVSVVAPAREVSVIFGVLFGAHLLREGDAMRRLGAAALTACGVALLAVS